ncbi:AP-like endonuclease reverse transcriptase [Brachionus plicatilis]|uniref:AP-like endonuclease reverse transcriptase n=1 Tax=Brachionus plicatilis TaxID=10195 RepID=A0A3M7PEB8_BRAPC|nr:AP-like endonuclease reverse transcriptase [Brachionus plicatilis]
MINTLKILHLNIQSINSETKIIQLTNLAKIYKTDIISLNETFLDPNKQLIIPCFNIFCSDRIGRRGGGSAICIRNNIFASQINLTNLLSSENAVGIELQIGQNNNISIFSIYSSPSTKLNETLLNHISLNYKNYIRAGDLNCKNKIWHCQNDNSNGIILENFLSRTNGHIVNCARPTYNRGKSVIDLSITSSSMLQHFQSHQV